MTARIVAQDKVFYSFGPGLEPALTVKQGELLRLQMRDCCNGQISSEEDSLDSVDSGQFNPTTGPVFFEGTKPGDILRVDILDLTVDDVSIMAAIPGRGALGDMVEQKQVFLLTRQDDHLLFHGRTRIPVSPMVGVIGVAPPVGSVCTRTPGHHGGNMDCALVAKGASLYFEVGVSGALFGAGDVHAAMGDGEVMICGAETSGELVVRAQVVPLRGLPTPFVRNSQVVAAIFSDSTLDRAADGATHAMASFLVETVGIPINEAAALMSLAGNLKICQVVNPKKTVRFELPRWVLESSGFILE